MTEPEPERTEERPHSERLYDNSGVSAYMTCPREFKLAVIDGWRPREQAAPLRFGKFVHSLLETHYKYGGDPAAIKATYDKYGPLVLADDHRTAPRALLDYRQYCRHYPPSMDCVDTVGFPDNPIVEIATSVRSPLGFDYAVKLDRVVRINSEEAMVEDHKTTSRYDKYYFAQFKSSNQMKGYVWAAQKLFPDLRIVGVRINALHVLTAKTEFLPRYPQTYTATELAEWEQNTAEWIERIKDSAARDSWPAHFGDNGCRRLYGQCKFFRVCTSSKLIRSAVLDQDYIVDHWDPLAVED